MSKITSTDAAVKTLEVIGASGQSVNILDIETYAGLSSLSVDSAGLVSVNGNIYSVGISDLAAERLGLYTKAEIDGVLVEAGLSARSDAYAPTFQDFNNIQTLMDDPEFICSTEFETLIEQVNTTSIINIILQILRIPVTKEFRAYRCGTKPSKPFLTLIVQKGKENKESLNQPFSSKNLQMPVAVGTTEGAEAKTKEPEEKTEEVKTEEPEEPKPEEPKMEEPEEPEVAPLPPTIEPKPEEAKTEEPKEEPEAASLPPTIEPKPEEPKEEPKEEPVTFHAPGPKQGGRRPRRTIRH